MGKIFSKIVGKKKSDLNMIIPKDIQYRYEEGNESEQPILLIALFTEGGDQPAVVALDANLASALTNVINKSPMRMFIRTEQDEKDVMYQ